MRAPRRVVVLGAGPAGLATACYLAEHGVSPLVVEQEDHVGGLCRTLSQDGFRFDIGGHRWYTKNDEVDRWVNDLMGADFLRVHRVSRIYFRGRYFTYPVSLSNVLENMGPLRAASAALSYLAAQRPFQSSPLNMEEAFTRQFGRRLYEMFFKTYSEKVWGRSCTELSADWVSQRTKGLSAWSALRGVFSKGNVESLVEEFSYPRKGYGQISERMAEQMARDGGTLALRTRVVGIVVEEGGVTGVRVQGEDGTTRHLAADAVVSTLPLPLCLRLLETTVPSDVQRAADLLRFRNLMTVAVLLDRDRVGDDTWLYIHDPKIPFARIHEPRNWSPAMAPAGKTSLVVEYFVDRGDALSSKSDAQLAELTVEHLSGKLGLVNRHEVLGFHVFRARNAYPIYTLGYDAQLRSVKSYVAGISNLLIAGRGGSFRYNNSDHSIEMGIAVAKNLLGDRQDPEEVNTSPEYLEERPLRPSDARPAPAIALRSQATRGEGLAPGISVIIPAFNEKACLGSCIARTFEALDGIDHEVVVVDDGSSDGTAAVARAALAAYPSLRYVGYAKNRGKSHAIQRGLQECSREYVSYLDADLQYDPADVVRLYREACATGSPFIMGASPRKYDSPVRRVLSFGFNLYVSALFGLRIADTNSLKVLRRDNLDRISFHSGRWMVDLEVILGFRRQGCELRTHPVTVRRRMGGRTKWGVYSIALTAIQCARLAAVGGRRPAAAPSSSRSPATQPARSLGGPAAQ